MEVLPVCLAPVSTITGRVFAERFSRGSTSRGIHICKYTIQSHILHSLECSLVLKLPLRRMNWISLNALQTLAGTQC